MINNLDLYALNGYRTIMYVMREVEPKDVLVSNPLRNSLNDESKDLTDSEMENDIETKYTLLGVSGVEDLL